jgi:NADH-quinone oxidoreductase subunit J
MLSSAPILALSADALPAALFYAFAVVTAISAVGVAVSRNIVRTAVWLLFTLLGVGGLYFLLHAEFLAAVQLVVYAGGTLILIVFGVMLTSKGPFSRFEPRAGEVAVALAICLVLVVALVAAVVSTRFASHPIALGPTEYPVAALGQVLLGDYLVPFEVVSVLLLVVMIGAAYLATGRRRESDEPAGEAQAPAAAQRSGLGEQARQWS